MQVTQKFKYKQRKVKGSNVFELEKSNNWRFSFSWKGCVQQGRKKRWHSYLDLDEKIAQMFSEAGNVLVQVEQALDRHFELQLRQVREGAVQYLGDKVLNKQDVGGSHGLGWRCLGRQHCRIQWHCHLKTPNIRLLISASETLEKRYHTYTFSRHSKKRSLFHLSTASTEKCFLGFL